MLQNTADLVFWCSGIYKSLRVGGMQMRVYKHLPAALASSCF